MLAPFHRNSISSGAPPPNDVPARPPSFSVATHSDHRDKQLEDVCASTGVCVVPVIPLAAELEGLSCASTPRLLCVGRQRTLASAAAEIRPTFRQREGDTAVVPRHSIWCNKCGGQARFRR